METGIFEIQFNDGRVFRALYMNSSQKDRILRRCNKLKEHISHCKTITNGIHTAKDFENPNLIPLPF